MAWLLCDVDDHSLHTTQWTTLLLDVEANFFDLLSSAVERILTYHEIPKHNIELNWKSCVCHPPGERSNRMTNRAPQRILCGCGIIQSCHRVECISFQFWHVGYCYYHVALLLVCLYNGVHCSKYAFFFVCCLNVMAKIHTQSYNFSHLTWKMMPFLHYGVWILK